MERGATLINFVMMIKLNKLFFGIMGLMIALAAISWFRVQLDNFYSIQKELKAKGFFESGAPCKLYLGCEESHLDSYINIDFLPCNKNFSKADVIAEPSKLAFAVRSIDEIRLHHVSERFSQDQMLGFLVRWQEWLKVGGVLHIEASDLEGCAQGGLPKIELAHLRGSSELFEQTLSMMGFEIVSVRADRWDVEMVARKVKNLSHGHLKAIVKSLLDQEVSNLKKGQI